MSWGWVAIAVVGLIVAAAIAEAWYKQGRRRNLSAIKGAKDERKKRPLGTEAIDMSVIARAHNQNEVIELFNTTVSRLGKTAATGAINFAKKLGSTK